MKNEFLPSNLVQFVTAEINRYVNDAEMTKKPVVKMPRLPDLRKILNLDKMNLKSAATNREAKNFLKLYLEYTTRIHHPGYIAHQVAIPHFSSAIADFINGSTNNGMGVYEMGPAGVVIENFVVEWLAKKIGWDTHSGVLVFGGSIANLTALLAARAAIDPNAWTDGINKNDVFVAPAVSHYSIKRAVSIMGYGEKATITMPVNERGIVIVDRLPKLFSQIESDGKRVIAVTGNACATATGLYDPIDELAEFCISKKLWFHVDGAHGASALLTKKYNHLMRGTHKANSVIWDMHKMLQTSALCAAVIFKDPLMATETFKQNASYLGGEKNLDRDDIFKKSIECTRAPIGFRFFLNLMMQGEFQLGRFVEKQYSFTHQVWKHISKQKDFECPTEPHSNILLFRFVNKKSRTLDLESQNNLQTRIYDSLIASGEFYTTQAFHNQVNYLRLTIMNGKTDMKHIRLLLEAIRKIANSDVLLNGTKLETVKNFGPVTLAEYHAMGITTLEQIENLGFENMCLKYVSHFPERLNANAFLGIICSIEKTVWTKATRQQRQMAKNMVQTLKYELGLK